MGQQREPQGVGGPFVSIATFCERVLQETDGVHTLVRVVDSYRLDPLQGVALPPEAKPAFETYLYVAVKSGDFVGSVTVTVKLRRPSGSYPAKDILQTPMELMGGQHGATLVAKIAFGVEEVGLHWADIELDGKLVTRVPLYVEMRSTQPPESSATTDAH